MPRKNKSDFNSELAKTMSSAQIKQYLDDREALFASEYLKDLNGTQAAIRAGYKPGKDNASAAVQASRLMRDDRIRAYRTALIRESVENLDVSRNTVVLQLLEIYRRCMALEPVMEWDGEEKCWKPSGVWRFDAKGASKALEQLSKLMGFEAPIVCEHRGERLEDLAREIGGRSY